MNCQLIRNPQMARPDGIFGEMLDENGNEICVTLEHSWSDGKGGLWVPKLATGTYDCELGSHQLKGMAEPFQTFQIMNVPNFLGLPVNGILFHPGNFDDDSEGCVLLGQDYALEADKFTEMITASRATFQKFMALQAGISRFTLAVS